ITALHVQRVLSVLGIREQVSERLKFAKGGPNGRVSVLVATGEAEIGLQQVSELMSNPDVEVIGLLPDKLQQITINAAGITAAAREPDAARALIKHLTTSEALAIYKAKGLGLSFTTASHHSLKRALFLKCLPLLDVALEVRGEVFRRAANVAIAELRFALPHIRHV